MFITSISSDIKNFKTISIQKKIIYIAIILLIIILMFNLLTTKNAKVVKSDNFYEMRFNLKMADFCQIYNKNLDKFSKDMNVEFDSDSVLFLSDTYFEKQTIQNKQSGLDMYIATIDLQGIKTSFVFYTEPNSNYIVGINLMANKNHFNTNNTNNTAYTTMVTNMFIPSIIKTLDPSINETSEIWNSLNETTYYSYLKNNRIYTLSDNSVSNTFDFVVMAISENKYNELYSTDTITENTNNSISNTTQNQSNTNEMNYIEDSNINNEFIEDNMNETTNSTTSTIIQNNTNNQTNSSSEETTTEEEFTKDNEYAYTKYCLLFDNGETYDNLYIEIVGENIYFYDKDSDMTYTGTYTSSNGYLVGTYTEVSYNNGGYIDSTTISDNFKFEILQNHKLKDVLGYGHWCGQVMGKNNTYILY